MSKRALSVSILTAGLSAGLIAGAVSPAAAQGNPVGGSGSVYFLSGAGSTGGQAQVKMYFGDPGDEVYFGDWDGDGADTPMVRRGGTFHVADQAGKTVSIFGYGNPGDQVLVGDWDGNGEDSIAVRRGNHFFVKNDNTKTGKADAEFSYGNDGDTVLVGDWDGDDKDTLIVQRQSQFFVKNDTKSGVAEYDFFYGNPGDAVLVGDWANPSEKESGNGADQLAVRRLNHYFLSTELGKDKKIEALRDIYYGEADDTVFVAALPTDMKDANGKPVIDEVRKATYSEDVLATYKAGEVILNWETGKPVTDPVTGKAIKAQGGEEKVSIKGDPAVWRGGEEVVDAAGDPITYAKDQKVDIHKAADYVLNEDGTFLRNDKGARQTWGDLDKDNTKYPDVNLTAPSNKVSVKEGDAVVRRSGELRERAVGELAFYAPKPADGDTTDYGWVAGGQTVTQATNDYLLDANGNLRYNEQTGYVVGAELKYTGVDVKSTEKAQAGAPVLARKGQPMPGFELTGPYADAVEALAQGQAAIKLADETDAEKLRDAADAAQKAADDAATANGGTRDTDLDDAATEADDAATAAEDADAAADLVDLDDLTQDIEDADRTLDSWLAAAPIANDEAINVYTQPAAGATKVADLDSDDVVEPGYYKGGEQLTYTARKAAPLSEGGETFVQHHKGDVILDEDGKPVMEGTGKALQITGDGLGVRRNFG